MIDRWKIAFIKLWLKKKKKWNIYTRRVVNDRYDINRNRITRRSLASFAPSIEMFFPQIWFQQDLAANRSPTLFASVMKYSLLFSTWFYINIYVCIRTFRNLLASFHKLNTREIFGFDSISANERTEVKEFQRAFSNASRSLFAIFKLFFIVWEKGIKVNGKIMRVVGRALRETIP